jgi:type VI protein secretion system component VasF
MLPNLPENMGQMQGTNTLNRIRAMDTDELAAIRKAAEAGVDQNVAVQVRRFEDKSMRWRALALWGTFFIISLAVAGIYYLHH